MVDSVKPEVSPQVSGAAPPPVTASAKVFPCESCGAELTFHIGQQALKCGFCGFLKTIDLSDAPQVGERDLNAMLQRLAAQRASQASEELADLEARCRGCGATLVFRGTVISSECAYCGAAMQREDAHTAEHRVPTDGVLPFRVQREVAQQNLRGWVKSRWFAPGDFKKRGVQGRFNGVYLPFWTFDAMTLTHYRGERGEHYYVEVGSGDNKRRERRTRWYPASGSFQRFFDDVLVCGAKSLDQDLIHTLEPWPLREVQPTHAAALAGYSAMTYDLPLDEAFSVARARMDDLLEAEVRQRIGGDTQRVHSIDTRHDALTYKHVLLPVWLLAYRYKDKPYQVVVNACTGEVQGERPWSAWKIAFAVLTALVVLGWVLSMAQQ